ncbi:hypothetical protein SDC9_172510 [bioreactor metagenome]|uniref:Uncharacterized protein n=1 Tax=bioreactor metagenome TaxID=1076179 RepID=A0A645GN25_9ZZZZ
MCSYGGNFVFLIGLDTVFASAWKCAVVGVWVYAYPVVFIGLGNVLSHFIGESVACIVYIICLNVKATPDSGCVFLSSVIGIGREDAVGE